MRPHRIWLWSLCALEAYAFRDSSPFFAFSTTRNLLDTSLLNSRNTFAAYGSHIGSDLARSLSSTKSCSQNTYILVSQPGVSAQDFHSKDAAPHLRQRLRRTDGEGSSSVIPNVVGLVDLEMMREELETACGVKAQRLDVTGEHIPIDSQHRQIIRIDLPSLPASAKGRARKLKEHDSKLNALISTLHHRPHTLIYTTTPRNLTYTPPQPQKPLAPNQRPTTHKLFDYDSEDELLPDHSGPLHTYMQRDLSSRPRRRQDEGDDAPKRPLFERYNYLSPGIFMGLLATILLGSILYVGVSAVAGLEVTYGAFAKEMGPAAQRK